MGFYELTILFVVAGVFGLIAKLLKQPLLVGYLFAGIFVAVAGFVSPGTDLSGLGKIGVALLLFLLGMEMNLSDLSSVGKVSIVTGLGQILFTSAVGFLLASILGFDSVTSLYIAVALSFSSTIIMVKLLSEKKDLASLYGKISVGFLLVQDFVAIAILIFLAGIGRGNVGFGDLGMTIAKLLGLFVVIYFLHKKALLKIFEKLVADSTELLFMVSISWALGFSAFVAGPLGLSIEIGGFLAGIALSNLPEHLHIASKTRSLRDFFLTIFFLYLGTELVVGGEVLALIPKAIALSLFVLIGNPIIVATLLGFLGYKKRTSFMAGLTVAQISEFSLILVAVGKSLGHLSSNDVSLVVIVGVITMTVSTYMIMNSDDLFNQLKKYLGIFERKRTKEAAFSETHNLEKHVILIGCDRTGMTIYKFLSKKNVAVIVIDFNPKVYSQLSAIGAPVVFGDTTDEEILSQARVGDSSLIISTISNLTDNLTILEYLRNNKDSKLTIFTTSTRREALRLYEAGASYVIVPEIVAGEHIKHLLRIYGFNTKKLSKAGKSHFSRLIFR